MRRSVGADLRQVMLKIKKSQGADYDMGSNRSGYNTSAGNIKSSVRRTM